MELDEWRRGMCGKKRNLKRDEGEAASGGGGGGGGGGGAACVLCADSLLSVRGEVDLLAKVGMHELDEVRGLTERAEWSSADVEADDARWIVTRLACGRSFEDPLFPFLLVSCASASALYSASRFLCMSSTNSSRRRSAFTSSVSRDDRERCSTVVGCDPS